MKKILIGTLLLLLNMFIFGENILFKKIVKEEESVITIKTEKITNGYRVEFLENDFETKISICNDLFDVKEWYYKNTKDKTDFKAKRQKDKIIIIGLYKGKPIDKQVQINQTDPWYQVLWLGIEAFYKSEKQTQNFWIIKPEDLEPISMSITKEQNEHIYIEGNNILATRLHLSLAGFLGLFWSCKVWVRPADGRMLLLKDEGKDKIITLYRL